MWTRTRRAYQSRECSNVPGHIESPPWLVKISRTWMASTKPRTERGRTEAPHGNGCQSRNLPARLSSGRPSIAVHHGALSGECLRSRLSSTASPRVTLPRAARSRNRISVSCSANALAESSSISLLTLTPRCAAIAARRSLWASGTRIVNVAISVILLEPSAWRDDTNRIEDQFTPCDVFGVACNDRLRMARNC